MWWSLSSSVVGGGAVRGPALATIPMRNIRIAEQHLDSLGPIGAWARQNINSSGNLGQSRIRFARAGRLRPVIRMGIRMGVNPVMRPVDPVEAGGNIQKFAADLEVNSFQHGVG